MSNAGYPPAPWHTRGWAFFRAYLVPADGLRLPEGFEVEARGGYTLGALGVVDYRPPSPLAYRELVWMPARVRVRRQDGKTARGFFVAKMFVDDESSRAAGRELWGLPKELARFDYSDDHFEMHGGDGSHVRVELGMALPGVPSSSSVVTLQPEGGGIVRFRGDTRARFGPRRACIETEGLDGTWQGFEHARPLGPLGVELRSFETTMQPPERFPRG